MGKVADVSPEDDLGEFALFLVELICALTPGQRYALISAERGSPASLVRRPHSRSIAALRRRSLLEPCSRNEKDDEPRPTYLGSVVASALMAPSATTQVAALIGRSRSKPRGSAKRDVVLGRLGISEPWLTKDGGSGLALAGEVSTPTASSARSTAGGAILMPEFSAPRPRHRGPVRRFRSSGL
jgi:hypothetical protein